MNTENTFVNEPNRVIIYDELAKDVIYAWLDPTKYPESGQQFLDEFEFIKPVGYFLAEPNEDFYQGINVMAVIKRKADGKLFGYEYWTSVSKYGEAMIESNGEKHGFDFDIPPNFDWNNDYYPGVFVWLPIEPFTITGYKIITDKEKTS